MPLETVDIAGVEVLATGGPVKAIGSPPEGDFYSRADLERMAEAMVELGDEIRAPLKIGHSDRQQLLANSGLTAGEMPAIGWLDSRSFRVEDDPETGGAKLLADAKAVPKKVDELIKTGAYRTRSSEIKRYVSQITEKTYDWVVSGLALLGGQIPAIQTLDDVYRLYEERGFEAVDDETVTYVIRHAAGEVLWAPDSSLESLRGGLQELLNPGGYDVAGSSQLWVRDIALTGDRALVSAGWSSEDDAWVVAFTAAEDGSITVAPRSEWKAAEQTWTAAADENLRAAESRTMAAETITTEALAPLAEKLGVDGDLTVEALEQAVEERANELAEAKAKLADRSNEHEGGEKVAELEKRLEASERRLFEADRDQTIAAAIRDGKINPAEKEGWEKRFERDAELTKEVIADLRVDDDLVREFGREEQPEEQAEAAEKAYKADASRRFGIPEDEVA